MPLLGLVASRIAAEQEGNEQLLHRRVYRDRFTHLKQFVPLQPHGRSRCLVMHSISCVSRKTAGSQAIPKGKNAAAMLISKPFKLQYFVALVPDP